MKRSFPLKSQLKTIRWLLRRQAAAWRWGAGELQATPAVLGNAMPKSGSHLIIQVLQGLTRLGPFVNPGLPPVNRAEDNRKLEEAEVIYNIQRMKPGDIAYGYVHSCEPYLSLLTAPGRATVFVYRDPRDMIVSHVFYATQIHPGHAMHAYYTHSLDSMEQRINAAIHGVDDPDHPLSSVLDKYQDYIGWLEQDGVLCLRFEDLILERDQALNRILDYLAQRGFRPRLSRNESVEILKQAVIPKKSGTFRKAQPGNWREYFTPGNKNAMKTVCGDLLLRLGYEKDQDW